MKQILYIGIFLTAFFLSGCSSTKYIHDTASCDRQRELKNSRAGAITGEVFVATFSVLLATATDTEIEYFPAETRFKKILLQNPTSDTLFVNMLTDVGFDNKGYCDFMDIRIPPGKKCRLLCPLNADYNVYFRNCIEKEEDEMVTFNTGNLKTVTLKPGSGLTFQTK